MSTILSLTIDNSGSSNLAPGNRAAERAGLSDLLHQAAAAIIGAPAMTAGGTLTKNLTDRDNRVVGSFTYTAGTTG